MNPNHKSENPDTFQAKVTFSGAGVLHIKSSELVKTKQAIRQIAALKELTGKMKLTSV